MIAQGFQAFDGLALNTFAVALIEVLDPQVDVGLVAVEHVPEVHDQRMGDDDRSPFGALGPGHPPILSADISGLGPPGRLPGFDQSGPQTAIAGNGPPRQTFPSTFVVARSQPNPLRQRLGSPKGSNGGPDFAQYGFGRPLPNPRMAFNQRLGLGQRGLTPLDLGIERGNLLVQRRQVLPLRGEQKLLMAGHQSVQRPSQVVRRGP